LHGAGTFFERARSIRLCGPNIAVKVINHHSEEVMKVCEVN